jgi:chromatin assembly factor 1 subunit B
MTASIDNSSRIVDVACPNKEIGSINSHSHYVQGVAWDPLNQYVVTCSSDRTVKVSELVQAPSPKEVDKKPPPKEKGETPTFAIKLISSIESYKKKLFADEQLATFFRRLVWSPEGSLLLIPAGLCNVNPLLNNTMSPVVHVFVRGNWKQPAWTCPMPEGRPAVAIRCSPVLYKLRNPPSSSKDATPAIVAENEKDAEETERGEVADESDGSDLIGAKFYDEELGECVVSKALQHKGVAVLWCVCMCGVFSC